MLIILLNNNNNSNKNNNNKIDQIQITFKEAIQKPFFLVNLLKRFLI